jgi:ATP-binding cassette subfamily F protein 3
LSANICHQQERRKKARVLSIGYLHQDLLSFDYNDSIFEVALSALRRVQQLEKGL